MFTPIFTVFTPFSTPVFTIFTIVVDGACRLQSYNYIFIASSLMPCYGHVVLRLDKDPVKIQI